MSVDKVNGSSAYGAMPSGGATIDVGGQPASPVGVSSSLRVRGMYGLYLVVGFVIGLLLRFHAVEWVTKWAIGKGCTDVPNASSDWINECIGDQGAYRVSFALFIFFAVHWIMSSRLNLCMDAAQRVSFNTSTGASLFRLIAFVAALLISFVIPNNFFVVYAWLCVVISVLFLIGQLLILLEFSYSWNEKWVSQEETRFQVGLLVATSVLFIAGLVVTGFMYKWFGSEKECQTGQGFITMTLIAAVVYTLLSIWSPHGSLLPSSVVFAYTVWTCYSALSSGIPSGPCNTITTNSTTQLIIGAVISCISLVYCATNAATSRDAFSMSSEPDEVAADGGDLQHESANFSFFHLMMMTGAAYLAMLLTSWSVVGSSTEGLATVNSGSAPMWSKFASLLVCILFYLWSMAAPFFCKDREF